MKTIIFSIIGFAAILVFLFLWLTTSSNLDETDKKLKITENHASELENQIAVLKSELDQIKSELTTTHSALDKSLADVTNKDSELTSLKNSYNDLKKSLSDAESDLKKLKAEQLSTSTVPAQASAPISTANDANERQHLVNQVGGLIANLTTVSQERDRLKSKLEQAEKNLEACRAR
jgi:chromosome segregation ATPase